MRYLFWIGIGLVLGAIVHLATILILPQTATRDAYHRIEPITSINAVTALPTPSPERAIMPYMDPAFAYAICRYDLASGPIKVIVPVSQAYTALSFYNRNGVAYYAINDRAAGRRLIELELMTPEQRGELPDDEDITAADRLIVESPTPTGLVLLKALAPEPGAMPVARGVLAAAQCRVQPPDAVSTR